MSTSNDLDTASKLERDRISSATANFLTVLVAAQVDAVDIVYAAKLNTPEALGAFIARLSKLSVPDGARLVRGIVYGKVPA